MRDYKRAPSCTPLTRGNLPAGRDVQSSKTRTYSVLQHFFCPISLRQSLASVLTSGGRENAKGCTSVLNIARVIISTGKFNTGTNDLKMFNALRGVLEELRKSNM